MEQLGGMKLYTFEEVKGSIIGKVGTPERDEYEREVEGAVRAYQIGEAIKNERIKQNLTQEELGKRIGVQKAQISRMEKGYCTSLFKLSCVFKALGAPTGTLDLGIAGKVTLW